MTDGGWKRQPRHARNSFYIILYFALEKRKSSVCNQFLKSTLYLPIQSTWLRSPSRNLLPISASSEPESEINLTKGIALSFQANARNESVGFALGDDGTQLQKQPKLAMMMGRFWRPGSELKIAFIAGSEWQKNKVREHAVEWLKSANLTFKWIEFNSQTADIVIDFDETKGSWSALGTDSLRESRKGKPSMNFGWVKPGRSEDSMRRTILHEFGHALGAVHEHSSPQSKIPWNKEVVYEAYAKPPNKWSKQRVDYNVFKMYTFDQVQATQYDPDSIMLNYYPPSYTLDNSGTKLNQVLSKQDQAYMRFCYPPNPITEVGLFNSMEVSSPPSKPLPEYKHERKYAGKYNTPPSLVLGLNFLDMGAKRNIRAQIAAQDQEKEKFTAGIKSWSDSILHAGGMTWLEVGPKFDYLQTGTVDLSEIFRWGVWKAKNWKWVSFPKSFKTQPKVVCFIQGLDLDHTKNWRVKTYPTRIDNRGFYINIDSFGDTIMYGARVSWIAYPADQPGVTSGRFSTGDIRRPTNPRPDNSSTAKFDKQFAKPPTVMMALDELDYSCEKNLRVRVSSSMISENAIDWNLESWEDSVMYGAGASFFAFGEPAPENRGLAIF